MSVLAHPAAPFSATRSLPHMLGGSHHHSPMCGPRRGDRKGSKDVTGVSHTAAPNTAEMMDMMASAYCAGGGGGHGRDGQNIRGGRRHGRRACSVACLVEDVTVQNSAGYVGVTAIHCCGAPSYYHRLHQPSCLPIPCTYTLSPVHSPRTRAPTAAGTTQQVKPTLPSSTPHRPLPYMRKPVWYSSQCASIHVTNICGRGRQHKEQAGRSHRR